MRQVNRRRIYSRAILALTGMWLLTGGMAATPAAAQFFNERSLQGDYGFVASGTLDGNSALGVGRFTFDGKGACSFVVTVNIAAAGGQGPVTATSCIYAVQADGTGTQTSVLPVLGTFNNAFVIVDNKKEIHMITLDPGVSATALLKKQ